MKESLSRSPSEIHIEKIAEFQKEFQESEQSLRTELEKLMYEDSRVNAQLVEAKLDLDEYVKNSEIVFKLSSEILQQEAVAALNQSVKPTEQKLETALENAFGSSLKNTSEMSAKMAADAKATQNKFLAAIFVILAAIIGLGLITSRSISADIAEHKRVEQILTAAKERAEKASRAKSEFLANMSHEIRTPMNAVVGFTDLLIGTSLDKTQKEYVGTISESGKELISLVNDILDVSKIEAGQITLENVNFNLKDMIEGVLKIIRLKTKNTGVELLHEIDSNISSDFIGDPTRLRQILSNLLGNAVKFTHRGWIKLSVNQISSDGENLVLQFSIKDTGIGIPSDKLEEIFDPFTQADTSTTRQYGGSGLGLYIVKTFVQKMNGSIQVESVPQEGSEFIFTIKLQQASHSAIPAIKEHESAEESFKGAKILVTEDNPVNLQLITAILKRLGCQIDTATHGQEAIAKLKQNSYDIVLMDMQMPVMGGIEATRAIRREINPHIPIIGLTADVMKEDEEAALAAGMNDYLTKPVSVAKLKEKFTKWLHS